MSFNLLVAAILQLKHSIDRHWKIRGGALDDQNKGFIKNAFVQTLLNEQNGQIAIQAAVVAAKIIRKDGNGSWPDLFNHLQEGLIFSIGF